MRTMRVQLDAVGDLPEFMLNTCTRQAVALFIGENEVVSVIPYSTSGKLPSQLSRFLLFQKGQHRGRGDNGTAVSGFLGVILLLSPAFLRIAN